MLQKMMILGVVALGMSACATTSGPYATDRTGVDNSSGRATIYNDVREAGPIAGIGIESQDIVSMSDKMTRDMMTNPTLAGRDTPPRILIAAEDFKNNSSSRINVALITSRLRNNLNRASRGRMVFIGRGASTSMIERERALKRDGMTDGGTIRHTKATGGIDYGLSGEIITLDSVQVSNGLTSRFHQISFEMYDLELGTIVWSNIYDFEKTAQDDILYR
jgi:PBP1b-binding outer membrane lipoprotein LpoB